MPRPSLTRQSLICVHARKKKVWLVKLVRVTCVAQSANMVTIAGVDRNLFDDKYHTCQEFRMPQVSWHVKCWHVKCWHVKCKVMMRVGLDFIFPYAHANLAGETSLVSSIQLHPAGII